MLRIQMREEYEKMPEFERGVQLDSKEPVDITGELHGIWIEAMPLFDDISCYQDLMNHVRTQRQEEIGTPRDDRT